MRRIWSVAVICAVLLCGSGCVAVSAKHNRLGSERQAVVVKDRLYIVNTSSGVLYELNLDDARPWVAPTEKEDENRD